MKSEIPGTNISIPEVLNVSTHGFWLMVADREHFLAFADFPWFRAAILQQLFNVELHHGDHLY